VFIRVFTAKVQNTQYANCICNVYPKEVTEGYKLYNGELSGFYAHAALIGIVKSRRTNWVGQVVCMGGKRSTFRLLVAGCRCRWEDNIKMNFQEMGREARLEFMWLQVSTTCWWL